MVKKPRKRFDTGRKKGDVGKSGTQYGYTLEEYDEMGEKMGLFVSPKEWWSSREGKKYTDSFGRTQTIGNHSQDERQEMQSYGYRIAIGMDLGSDKIPASARKYVLDNNLMKSDAMAKGGRVKLIFHGSSREIPMGEFETSAAAKRYVESSDWKRPYSIKKIEPKVARTQFEEEVFEYADGGDTDSPESIWESTKPIKRVKMLVNAAFDGQKYKHTQNELIEFSDLEWSSLPEDIRSKLELDIYKYADGGQFDFKPYGKTKGRYKIEYVEEGKKQSEVWESKEMVEDRGKKLLKLGCTNIKITKVKKMARGGEPKPSLIPDYKKISGIEVEDIDMADYPDFSDAYISYAEYDGEPMTDEQLEELNQDGYIVYEAIQRRLFADGGKVRQNKKDKLWESIKNKFSEIFYLRETNPNEIFSNDVIAEKNEYLYFAAAWVTTTLSFEEAENKFMKMLTDDEKKMIKIERNVKDINEAFGLMSEKKILVKRIDKMADGGEVSLWKVDKNKVEKLKTGSKRAIKGYITKNKLDRATGENWGLQEWPTDVTEEQILRYNRSNMTATSQEYARGGKVKSRWIQDALSGNKGELRKTAKRKGLIKGDEKLSNSDLRKLQKMGGKTAKRARLAETLIEFKK
jgi:hypothetical protein